MYTGSTSEWRAATSLFIANAGNLMKSVRSVLKSTKSALELPNNYLASAMATATPQPPLYVDHYHNSATAQASLATLPTSSPHKLLSNLNPLSINDAPVVYKNLYTLRAKWKTVGMFLCVPHHSLEAIGADNESCDDRLTALIALWLRRITPTPTWHALSDAVHYIDQDKAREIMTNNCGR